MIQGQTVLGVIPARGGSKGIPGKNIRPVGGKPLIAWTIEAARRSKYLDRLILSSDDDAIIATARAHGCEVPFKRDPQLARDETPGMDVVLDAMERCPGFEWIVLLQPTSPLRTTEDIDAALTACIERAAPACVSVCEAQQSPYWMYVLDEQARLTPILEPVSATRRQDLPAVYALNGAVYVARQRWLSSTRDFKADGCIAYRMPADRSVDLDTPADLLLIEAYLTARSA
jgi:N-acylneuraminate cytidylyltransferase